MPFAGGFVRPPAAVVVFAMVGAWTLSAGVEDRTIPASRSVGMLRANPEVRPSYVRPPTPAAATSSFTVAYTNFSPQAQTAFEFAVKIWAAKVSSPVPIRVEAGFHDLSSLGAGVLADYGIGSGWHDDVPDEPPFFTFYPSALSNRLDGYASSPSPDLRARFNSTTNWYFGTDGLVPFGSYDFVTAVLHEIGHGLGFYGSGFADASGTYATVTWDGAPWRYDRFVFDANGRSILDYPRFSNPELARLLTGGNLFFSGPLQRAANGSAPARLHAPAPFDPLSSYSHLDETTYGVGNPNSLMTPFLASAEAIHDPGPVALGMLHDLGWDPSIPPCTHAVIATSTTFPAAGGSGAITVATGGSCNWQASSGVDWLALSAARKGSGSAVFSVAATSGGLTRHGTISVAGQQIAISQEGLPCTFGVGRDVVTFGAGGGAAPLTVTASPSDCVFNTSTSAPWVTVSGQQSGNTTLTIAAGAAGAATRSATVTIGGIPVTVRQNGHRTPTFDINHDGAADLVAYDPVSGSRFFAFADPRNLGFSTGAMSPWSAGWGVFPGDFNGDGRSDLFFYNSATGRAIKALATGAETFAYTEFAWPAGWQVTVADFNGDGRDDLSLYNPTTGVVHRCTNGPDGSFSFCAAPGSFWSPNWSIHRGDFNRDGWADLFVYNASGDANRGRWYRVMTEPGRILGTGPEGHFVSYIEGDLIWRNDWTITPGDYDGDGRTDLFLYRPSGEWYRVFFPPAGGTRYERGVWSPGWTLSAGDFNGDGRTDLFVYNESTGRWYMVISRADGSLAYYGDVFWSPGWKISVTDINVDGVADLILYNPSDGRWFQAVTRSPGVFTFANGSWPTGLQIIATRPQSR